MHWRAEELFEKAPSKEHPATLASMNHVVVALGSQGQCEETEAIYQLALGFLFS